MHIRSPNRQKLLCLTQREAETLHAVADTLFPAQGNGMPSVKDARVVEYIDDLLTHLPIKEVLLIRGLLNLLELQSLVFSTKHACLFSRSSLKERAANLTSWETSRFTQRRMVFTAIRTLLLWAYADSAPMERTIGIPSAPSHPPSPLVLRPKFIRKIAEHTLLPTELAATGTC
jgi:Gluconate 2-dehydrogenase subunit 3